MLDINRSSFAGVPPYRPTTGARAFRMPEAAGFDSPVGHSWAATSSALQKVCSSRGASNSMPFEPTTEEACVRCRPFWSTVCVAGLFSQAQRSPLMPGQWRKPTATCAWPLDLLNRRLGRLSWHLLRLYDGRPLRAGCVGPLAAAAPGTLLESSQHG